MTNEFRHASAAIMGRREHQEDAAAFAKADVTRRAANGEAIGNGTVGELIAVLADGMGGHVAGALASTTACRSYIDTYTQTRGPHRAKLAAALTAANQAIASAVERDQALDGMGCTLLGASFGAAGLRWVSVGDSLLYLFRDNKLYQLNENHSLAPVLDRLADLGEIEREAALEHPRRHFLRSALTGAEIEMVDLTDHCLPLQPGDWVLLASDGLETLSDKALANLLAEHRHQTPEQLVEAVIAAIEGAADPYQDNTTVMAVQPMVSYAVAAE